jgi:phosphoribosylformylglycinamidine synthase subunit PurQ / glutaminase
MTARRTQIALVRFPGSNCDDDMHYVLTHHFGVKVNSVWHTETSLAKADGVVLPGGFSFGDYLRSGALATHAPIMAAVRAFAKRGGPILGVCNGFQVLTEARLLPGVLLKNRDQRFICRFVNIAIDGKSCTKPAKVLKGKVVKIPIAHGDGRYFIGEDGLKELRDSGGIFCRYVDDVGDVTDAANPNGSIGNIAGISNSRGRIIGLMPHPERAANSLCGSNQGIAIMKLFLDHM